MNRICDRCKAREATSFVRLNYNGHEESSHLCGGCLSKLGAHGDFLMNGFPLPMLFEGLPMPRLFEGLRMGGFAEALPSPLRVRVREAEEPIADAGEDLKNRRRMAELRSRLSSAVKEENYQMAARLRDELYRAEKGERLQ